METNIIRGSSIVQPVGVAYAGTLSVGDTDYVEGAKYLIRPFFARAGDAPTLNLNGIGAKPLYKNGDVRLHAYDLIIGRWYEVIWNSVLDGFQVLGLPQTVTAEYSFVTHTGAIGTYVLTAALPADRIILRTKETIIINVTSPTSAGNALISWGITGSGMTVGQIDTIRPYNSPIFANDNKRPFFARNCLVGSFEITGGAAGSIDTVTVGGVNILNGAVAFNSTLLVTAQNVMSNINTNPNGNFRAELMGTSGIIYLYCANSEKYVEAYETGILAASKVVSATATTMTVGNFNNLATIGDGASTLAENIRPGNGTTSTITFTIAGATLTAGKLRMKIPYDVDYF